MDMIEQIEFKANGQLQSGCRVHSLVFSSNILSKTLLFLGVMSLTGCGLISGNSAHDSSDPTLKNGDLYSDGARASYQPIYVSAIRPIDLPYLTIPDNVEVKREMHRLLGKERKFMERSLRRQREYHAALEKLLVDEGVPGELLALAMVESSLDRNARSHAGAVGMWQFMPTTAKQYDLRVDFFHDERKDPVLSTIAAARMLQKMYKMFGSWELALAAYNCGDGGLKRRMQESGVSDFWELSRRGILNRETRIFVPRVLATAAILREPEKYGFVSAYPAHK